MNMKKLMAGVVAGALAVTSLATVGVFAEDQTLEYSFVGSTHTLTINYTKTINFQKAVEVKSVFPDDAGTEYAFGFDVQVDDLVDGHDGSKDEVNNYIKNLTPVITGDKTVKLTLKGTGSDGKAVSDVSAVAVSNVDKGQPVTSVKFRLRTDDDKYGNVLADGDLDIGGKLKNVTSLTLTATLSLNMGAAHIGDGAAILAVKPDFVSTQKPQLNTGVADADSLTAKLTSYKCTETTNNGLGVWDGNVYTFEEVVPGFANESLDVPNLLRWVNDNIEQNKGAKLRINFLAPQSNPWDLWIGSTSTYNPSILQFTGSESTIYDVRIGVNLNNTSKLQQGANIDMNTLSVEFDWDTLVQASTATVSGNVDSIAIRLNPASQNVNKLKSGKNGWMIGIKSVEIVIPDQATVEDGQVYNLIGGSNDENVTVSGTFNALFGNGATTLQVTSDFTDKTMSYTLKLTDGAGNYVQPAGTVTLKMSIPSAAKGKTLSSDKVKHTCNDGTVEELDIKNMDTYKTDGYVVCETNKFSSFEFSFEDVETEATTTEAPAVSEETTTEAPAADTQPADDGNQPTGVALAVIPAIVAAAGIVISKKRG